MSETAEARSTLEKFCNGVGLDMGFGGSSITPNAITFDMPARYSNCGKDKQILRGDCKDLSFICDECMDYIYSSHLLEDFTYDELIPILSEWRRVLKKDGLLVTNCPDQQKFLKHCKETGQPLNLNHKEQDFSLDNFKKVLEKTGTWELVYEQPIAGPYSWYLVVKKLD